MTRTIINFVEHKSIHYHLTGIVKSIITRLNVLCEETTNTYNCILFVLGDPYTPEQLLTVNKKIIIYYVSSLEEFEQQIRTYNLTHNDVIFFDRRNLPINGTAVCIDKFVHNLTKKYCNLSTAKKIAFFHNTHALDRTGYYHVIPAYTYLHIFDRCIVMTETQKHDLTAISKHYVDIVVQRMFVEDISTVLEYKNSQKVCMIGRYSMQKNKKLAINLFNGTSEILDMYGSGEEKENVIEYARDMNCTNVTFNNETQNVMNTFKQYEYSLCTSNNEGFCLNILESIVSGTPVLSINCKYGPSDIIDSSTGIICECAKEMKDIINSQVLYRDRFVFDNTSVLSKYNKNNFRNDLISALSF